jgi:sugar phosphate isomerase/epimerase
MLPDLPFSFHGGNLVAQVGIVPGAVARIAAYLRCTGSPWAPSPWASMHLTLWPPGMLWLMLRRGWRLPLPDPDRSARRLVRQVATLQRALGVPLLLENTPGLPWQGYGFEAEPERIAAVLEESGCGLLLDTGHARVAAAAMGVDVHDYLERLPLERAMQLHVSGPRTRDGRLVDAHEPLREIDYALLDGLLARTHPQVVTLEYIRERDALREQLHRLRRMRDARATYAARQPPAPAGPGQPERPTTGEIP